MWKYLLILLAVPSCTFSINADGGKSGRVDGIQVLRAIEILNQK